MPEAGLLGELPEAQASGEQRRIYGEIKRLSAVPMVALIYRHLATMPGVLEWAWALLAPLMQSGALQERAWRLAKAVAVPDVLSIPRAAMRAAGIAAADGQAIAAVLDAYNRANPVNIVFVRCLALHLGNGTMGTISAPKTASTPVWQAPPPPAPLPAMIDPAAMSPAVRELVLLLTDRCDGRAPSPLWPSLYRHLAHWPAMLGFAGVLVPPVFAAIDVAAATLRAQVNEAASELAPGVAPPQDIEPPAAAQREQLRAAIDRFSLRIPEMVVIGGLLQRAMPDNERSAA